MTVGEKLRVAVLEVKGDKITLSMRALMANPLEAASEAVRAAVREAAERPAGDEVA